MEAVGHKCEMRGCKSKAYDVHHIKPVSKKVQMLAVTSSFCALTIIERYTTVQ
jgi:hypothetical protein